MTQVALKLSTMVADRLCQLLGRGGPLAIELERLSSLGIHVVTRADAHYPKRLKQVLGSKAPSVLFVAGDQGLLSREGLAVVGSRDVNEVGARFAEAVGQKCAEAGLTVISGAAKGVDRQSMTGALGSGGTAVGVPADSLEKAIAAAETRRPILAGQLVLVTPFHPRARFTIGAAMQRNKIIYGLARYALVVASAKENGGTWAGAVENLKGGWVPLFVRMGPDVPLGNRDLLARGGLEFPDTLLMSVKNLRQWLEKQVGAGAHGRRTSVGIHDKPEPYTPVTTAGTVTVDESGTSVDRHDVFPVVWPYISGMLVEPRTEKYIAIQLSLEVKQVKAWLTRALKEGLVRKRIRPVRYELVRTQRDASGSQGSLFDSGDS